MNLNRAELRKIIYDFNSKSNRLLQADYNEHTKIIRKFIYFIKSTPIIYDYVLDCGICSWNMDEEFRDICNSCGRFVFRLGDTDEEEVCNAFAILEYIAEKDINVCFEIAAGYTSSNKYQDRVKAFNNRVIMVLIQHIESFLTKVGIDMGIDEKITYSITVSNGQVNIASENATITATNNVGVDWKQLDTLIDNVKATASGITGESAEILSDNLEVIEEEVKSDKPKKGFIKTAIAGIKTLKGTAEFLAATTALIQFVETIL